MFSQRERIKTGNTFLTATALLIAAFSATACGPSAPSVSKGALSALDDASLPQPENGECTRTSKDPVVNALLGNYSGTLRVEDGNGDWSDYLPYAFNLAQCKVRERNSWGQEMEKTYLHMNFVAELSDSKEIRFSTYLGSVLNGMQNAYTFASEPVLVSELSSTPSSVSLILSVWNGKFYPAQSSIRMMDCGFYQAACLNPLLNIEFSGDLVKR